MRIIMLGPPGSGKGTQSEFISNKYNIPKISTGDILRNVINKNTTISKSIKNTINSGKLVNDNILCNLIKKKISMNNYKKGFLLDGFPRNLLQATLLKKEKIDIDYVIELSTSIHVIISRLKNRLVHIPSGRVYHSIFNPPKTAGIDDITGDQLTSRIDDTNEVIKLRFKEYQNKTRPLSTYFLQESKHSYLKYFKINGDNNIKTIKYNIQKILNIT